MGGFFTITTSTATVQGLPARHFILLHCRDEYSYAKGERCFLPIP